MVEIDGVTLSYGKLVALDDLTLSIPERQIYGLLGPNGAGKTSLIRLIVGLLRPTRGRLTLFGDGAPSHRDVRRRVGYMPQRLALYPALSVRENVLFFGRIYGLREPRLSARTDELLELVELAGRADALVGQLSGGMARRLMMATALIHEPKLVILDEPTAGVDPLLRLKFWESFAEFVAAGTSVIITTHHISEATRCDHVAFMRRGKLIAEGSPQALIERYEAADLEAAFVGATREVES